MIHYWFTIIKIFTFRKFQGKVKFDETIKRTFRVGFFDCDGLRVMAAFKYIVYMDFIKWELVARSKFYEAIVSHGLAPTLGSQKIIYRRPLKFKSKFNLILDFAGWDDKWIYHIHKFEQNNEIKAIGVTRALIWKKDKPRVLEDIMNQVGAAKKNKPSLWITDMFKEDKELYR